MAYKIGTEVEGYNGSVIFDGKVIRILRKGKLARMTVGKGEKSIPINSITAVQWKEPGALVNGFIQFSVAGGLESRSKVGRQTIAAAQDENSIVLRKGKSSDMAELRDAVMNEINRRATAIPSVVQQGSIADEISKLSSLRDSGVITEAEFEAQKSKLLS